MYEKTEFGVQKMTSIVVNLFYSLLTFALLVPFGAAAVTFLMGTYSNKVWYQIYKVT